MPVPGRDTVAGFLPSQLWGLPAGPSFMHQVAGPRRCLQNAAS